MEQGQVFFIGQASVTDKTFEQTDLDNPTSVIRNRKVKINTFFGQNVMTTRHTSDAPTGPLEGLEVTLSFGTRETSNQGT